MAFFPPIPLIRRNLIIKRLKECGANSSETAKTLAEAGVFNPNAFPIITEKMVKQGVIHKTADGKYYV